MVSVEIRGKEFPLCLTVAALDPINEKFGGLSNIDAFLFPKRKNADLDEVLDLYQRSRNLVWILGLLIQEGEENRLVEAQFSGARPERKKVPGSEELSHLLTVGESFKYAGSVTAAINESLFQDIEAAHSKNAENQAEPE